MYTVTWLTPKNQLFSVTTPNALAALHLYTALTFTGYKARLWDKNKSIIH